MDDPVHTDQQVVPRAHNGHWRGSGNPSGLSKAQATYRASMREVISECVTPEFLREAAEVFKKQVLKGESWAHEILWSRTWPRVKDVEEPLAIDLSDASLTQLRHRVLEAIASERITFRQAADLLQVAANTGRLLEIEQDEQAIKQRDLDRAEAQRLQDEQAAKIAALQDELRAN